MDDSRPQHVLAIDQGTTGTTAILFDPAGRIAARAYRELPQIYPRPGWVEHDPLEMWRTVVECVEEVAGRAAKSGARVAAVGITNQRETAVVWDAATGEPVHNAIVWQCRRTADACERLRAHEGAIRETTGLPLDAYFSGTKFAWILENASGAKGRDLRLGTVDSWLVWKLTGGEVHATDFTNASRTMLLDIRSREWSDGMCGLFGVPRAALPEVRASAGDYGEITSLPGLKGVRVLGVAGDQQAALFGQGCFSRGQVKSTYGTGCFIMENTGAEPVASARGLVTTLAVGPDGGPCYALEGSVFVAGAAVQWLRDGLGIISSAAESEELARSVADTGGVYLVPAFVGLGAPHWDMAARGTLVGLTRGTGRAHLARAALEAMAYQTHDVLDVMERETNARPQELAVDGGAAANDLLMQFQADVARLTVVRPKMIETTALGAAFLAGLGAGVWKDTSELVGLKGTDRRFEPSMGDAERDRLLAGWRKALRQAMTH